VEVNKMQDNDLIELNDEDENVSLYINVDEMAKILSIARVTAYQLTKTSGFPCFHIGKRIIIPLRSLHKWAEEQAHEQTVLLER
jgi:predicted DNA-binding transcriptional regulator AlpA